MDTLPVIFKKHYDRDLREWYVTAFFPTQAWSGYDMTCYQHVGQHGAACISYFNDGKKCKPEEYEDLLKELRGIYETNDAEHVALKVYSRKQPWMDDERRKNAA